eukprot:3910123-Lingulodinium_polyedra.AAC.1
MKRPAALRIDDSKVVKRPAVESVEHDDSMVALVQGEALTESKVQEHDRELSEQNSALNQATATCATMLTKKTTQVMEMEHKLRQVPNTSMSKQLADLCLTNLETLKEAMKK